MRSKLFVPGCRPEFFGKAVAGEADAISFDLEDSVPEDRKAEARARVAAFIAGDAGLRDSGKLVVVRTNAIDSPWFADDLAALVRAGAHWINLPKVESADAVAAVADRLAALEADTGATRATALLLNIETPRGLRRAARIGAAHPRVAGLQLGLGDLFEPHGIARTAPNLHATAFALRLAAAEAGVAVFDGAYPDVRDADGFRREAMFARELGFSGKSCIHPAQVALANAIFQPTAAEVATATRIVEAAAVAAAHGHGACAVDGRLVDPPFLRRAEAVLAAARRPPSA